MIKNNKNKMMNNINNINARLDVKSLQQLHHQDADDYFENHE